MSCQINVKKMSYYQFNRQGILQKPKERYYKERAAEYYAKNEEAMKENQERVIKACQKKKRQD